MVACGWFPWAAAPESRYLSVHGRMRVVPLLPVPVGDIPTHLVPHGVTFCGSRINALDRAPELLRGGTQGVVIRSGIMGCIRKSCGEGAE